MRSKSVASNCEGEAGKGEKIVRLKRGMGFMREERRRQREINFSHYFLQEITKLIKFSH